MDSSEYPVRKKRSPALLAMMAIAMAGIDPMLVLARDDEPPKPKEPDEWDKRRMAKAEAKRERRSRR